MQQTPTAPSWRWLIAQRGDILLFASDIATRYAYSATHRSRQDAGRKFGHSRLHKCVDAEGRATLFAERGWTLGNRRSSKDGDKNLALLPRFKAFLCRYYDIEGLIQSWKDTQYVFAL